MFIVSIDSSLSSIGKKVYFLNDTKDVIDICLSANMEDQEIKEARHWLNNATFGTRHQTGHVNILCVTDMEAYKMARFLGAANHYEKSYGKPALA